MRYIDGENIKKTIVYLHNSLILKLEKIKNPNLPIFMILNSFFFVILVKLKLIFLPHLSLSGYYQ